MDKILANNISAIWQLPMDNSAFVGSRKELVNLSGAQDQERPFCCVYSGGKPANCGPCYRPGLFLQTVHPPRAWEESHLSAVGSRPSNLGLAIDTVSACNLAPVPFT